MTNRKPKTNRKPRTKPKTNTVVTIGGEKKIKIMAKDLRVGDRWKFHGFSDAYGEVTEIVSIYPAEKIQQNGRIAYVQCFLRKGVHGLETCHMTTTDLVWKIL